MRYYFLYTNFLRTLVIVKKDACFSTEVNTLILKSKESGGGQYIKPTGKAFKIPMCTVGHWKNGVMIEESLFWDNATYMKQIGLGK